MAHGAFFVLLLGRFHSKGLGTSPPTGDLEDFMDFIPICILLAFSFYSGVSFWRCECLGGLVLGCAGLRSVVDLLRQFLSPPPPIPIIH